MRPVVVCRMKPYIQPFERTLALAELGALAQAEPMPVDHSTSQPLLFSVSPVVRASLLARQLAYWEVIEADNQCLTTQVLRERTVNVVRNGVPTKEIPKLLRSKQIPLPNRRCLRYGTHGIHEYRGKFFPQLVRSLINVANVPKHGVVADPMCGSGTTAVEAVLGGYRALGLDMNGLSVLMARVKCTISAVDPKPLVSAYDSIRDRLQRTAGKRNRLAYFRSLPARDQEYLAGWFSERVLEDLDEVAQGIQASDKQVRDFFWICLSNIIRSVSWQKEDDLRVRKEVRLDVEIDPIRRFLEELGRSVRLALAFLYQERGARRAGSFRIEEGDARNLATVWQRWRGKIDTIITSPPYATALPYLDTDRLSLCYLGLLPRPEHRRRDQDMIGNREINQRERSAYCGLLESKNTKLPRSVVALIQRVSTLNSKIEVGFRRRNLPALLTKYFIDMEQVFEGMAVVLRPGRTAHVVIGNNHTIAGGERVEIETASLLIDIAAAADMKCEKRIPMEMLVSRDIFKKNAVGSEEILCFRTKG